MVSTKAKKSEDYGWKTKNYCGCCGRECAGVWCADCRAHVAYDPRPEFERTYFALTGKPCPFTPDV